MTDNYLEEPEDWAEMKARADAMPKYPDEVITIQLNTRGLDAHPLFWQRLKNDWLNRALMESQRADGTRVSLTPWPGQGIEDVRARAVWRQSNLGARIAPDEFVTYDVLYAFRDSDHYVPGLLQITVEGSTGEDIIVKIVASRESEGEGVVIIARDIEAWVKSLPWYKEQAPTDILDTVQRLWSGTVFITKDGYAQAPVLTTNADARPARTQNEPGEQGARHNLGYTYMLEHNCRRGEAFTEAWLPDYRVQNPGPLVPKQVRDLAETFRVAVYRRRKKEASKID